MFCSDAAQARLLKARLIGVTDQYGGRHGNGLLPGEKQQKLRTIREAAMTESADQKVQIMPEGGGWRNIAAVVQPKNFPTASKANTVRTKPSFRLVGFHAILIHPN